MTTTERFTAQPDLVPAELVRRTWWDRVDGLTGRLAEWLNPILVKEARQALKGKQFSITFGLVLACGWVWSMLGVALIGPDIYYSPAGKEMFAGYFVILAFPLCVIVPFQAFRSLASEVEDGTYELLSITTLSPWQVVGGKLASAVLQMLIYLSALAPCLGFTYLLRGIDFPTIVYVLFYTFLGSLGLSLLSLTLATVTREKHWQVVLSVFVIGKLLAVFWISCVTVFGTMGFLGAAMQEEYFWAANAAVLTGFFAYFALFYCLAAGQLTFSTENRSTRLRVVMLVQQALYFGWIGWLCAEWPEAFLVWAFLFVLFSGMHWYLMGAFMTSETGELSVRVQRRLPQSFLGRAFLTWFNPGPGAGFVFSMVNLSAVVLVALVLSVFHENWFPTGGFWGGPGFDEIATFTALILCYAIIYLSLGRLLVVALRRVARVGVFLGALLHVLLLAIGCLLPMMGHLMVADWRDEYVLLEITNPIWTLIAVIVQDLGTDLVFGLDQLTVLLLVLPVTAVLALLIHLPSVAAEVRLVRVRKPNRVLEEDAQQEALLHPPQVVHTSPWD